MNSKYDYLTTPITTPYFQSRVLSLLSNYLSEISADSSLANIPLVIPALEPCDTPLSPGDHISQLVARSSSWIDLCSPDPLILSLSQQVFSMEIAYAAFCGIGHVIVPGPKLHHDDLLHDGLATYSRALKEALEVGSYLSLEVLLPMAFHSNHSDGDEIGSLAPFARTSRLDLDQVASKKDSRGDVLDSWDAWNIIRTTCKYSSRLFVGEPPVSIFAMGFSTDISVKH